MTTENQTQPTENAGQAQRDREMLERIAAEAMDCLENAHAAGIRHPSWRFDSADVLRAVALATRALELEEELRIFEEQHGELEGDYDDMEAELERMNGVVAGMEEDAQLGRLFREFIDHQHGYLEIDGGDPGIRNGSPVMVYGADDGKASQGMGGCRAFAISAPPASASRP